MENINNQSPVSVEEQGKDTKINPEFGTMNDFANLVNEAHSLGMKVIIDWVANAMREQYADRIEQRERHISTLHGQIKRITAMDETLYDDKLSGEISKERYQEKHQLFMEQKAELESQLASIDESLGTRLEQRLVVLELSQKAAELYAQKTPAQKRLIISKLFEKLTLKGGVISVKYSKFAGVIAQNVQQTTKLLEG
jgi:uncharacterized protein (UPF0335 family)